MRLPKMDALLLRHRRICVANDCDRIAGAHASRFYVRLNEGGALRACCQMHGHVQCESGTFLRVVGHECRGSQVGIGIRIHVSLEEGLSLTDAFRAEDAHVDPLFDQVAYARIWGSSRSTGRDTSLSGSCCGPPEVPIIKQPILAAECDEMCKQTVEMPLAAQMNQIAELSMVDVRKYAQKLFVNVLARRQKCRWKISTCFGRKRSFVRQQPAHPGHHVVNVLRCGQFHLFAILINPRVIQTWTGRHGRIGSDSAKLGEYAVELIEVVEKIKQVDADPFFGIDVFGDRRDRFQRSFD